MPDLADVFQLVACLPNVPKNSLVDVVTGGLARLDQIDPDVRKQYSGRLASRARHHKEKVDVIAARFVGVRVVDIKNVEDENHLRDFHHAVYYAGFYVGRYALVSNQSYDCSEHREIDRQLTGLGPSGSTVRRNAIDLATKLKSWRGAREVADYVMSGQRLEEFAWQPLIQDTRNDLDAALVTWSVP